MGPFSIGTHRFTIKATDPKGVSTTATGTFMVVKPIPPVVANAVVSEAAAPKNGLPESNEALKLAWTATSQRGIASHTITVDGRKISASIARAAGGNYCCVAGLFSIGTHRFTIRATDPKGVSASITGTFTVVKPVPPAISNAVVVETVNGNGSLESTDRLKLAWSAWSQRGIASQTVWVDGEKIATISRQGGSPNYSCILGKYMAGSHSYRIRSTDAKGVSSTYSGAFEVIAGGTATLSRNAAAADQRAELLAAVMGDTGHASVYEHIADALVNARST